MSMNLESRLMTHPVNTLRREIAKTNIKGYSKMKKHEIVALMAKHPDKFDHIQAAGEKVKKPIAKKAPAAAAAPAAPAAAPAKKVKLNIKNKKAPAEEPAAAAAPAAPAEKVKLNIKNKKAPAEEPAKKKKLIKKKKLVVV
jgi:hypothetical protein